MCGSIPPKLSPKPKSKANQNKKVKDSKTKALHIISSKEFKWEVEEAIVFALVAKEATHDITSECLLRWDQL